MIQGRFEAHITTQVCGSLRELRTMQQRQPRAAHRSPAFQNSVVNRLVLGSQVVFFVDRRDSCHFFSWLRKFFFQPTSDDLLYFVARLARFAPHVACARDDANVFWAAMFSEQVEIADRMLIVFLAVDA